jgi:PIN domain nuclease of toxin-antitoxin system
VIALLDTHTFLWAAVDPGKLSVTARTAIENPDNTVYLSTVSLWEIALKFSLGKLKLVGCTPEDLVPIAYEMGLDVVSPSAEEAAGFHRLPKHGHKDPFDRMLVWQCLKRDWTLCTRDRALTRYDTLGLRTFW